MSKTDSFNGMSSIVPTAAAVLRQELQALPPPVGRATPRPASGALPPSGPAAGSNGATPEALMVLAPPHPVEAGDAVYSSHALRSGTRPGCVVHATDLIGPSGHRIPAAHVRVSVRLASTTASAPGHLHIEVRVPSGSVHGCYTGYLQADDLALQALLKVTVGRSIS